MKRIVKRIFVAKVYIAINIVVLVLYATEKALIAHFWISRAFASQV